MKKLLILALCLTGCASRGALTYGVAMTEKPMCPKDRQVIIEMISVNTVWDTEEQTIEYSWQCTKNNSLSDTYRVVKILGHYKPITPREREMERMHRFNHFERIKNGKTN